MPLHLALMVVPAIAFMLWLAFQDPTDAEFRREIEAAGEAPGAPEPARRDAA